MLRRNFRHSISIDLAMGFVSSVSQAQIIEEIWVSAQMRDQSIEDVPLAVSLRHGSFLDTMGINSLEQVSAVTPGLIVQEQSPNNPGYVIRGISTDEGSPADASRVSIFLNGADIISGNCAPAARFFCI